VPQKCLNLGEPLTRQPQDNTVLVLGIPPLSSDAGKIVRRHWTCAAFERVLQDERPDVALAFGKAHLVTRTAAEN
jgi:hypothetical protein